MIMNQDNHSENYIPYQPGFEQRISFRHFILPAGHPLYGIVADFYQLETHSQISEVCVIPDGCIDLLFRYDKTGMTKTVEGYHRQKVMIPIHDVSSAFGVRFVPGGLMNIIDLQASELIGQQVPFTDLLEKDTLLDRMEDEHNFEDRIALISEYLLKKLYSNHRSSEIVKYCTQQIISSQGIVQITNLSKDTGYTLRYLRKLFHHYVGVSPKELCEIIQFQNSMMKLSCLQKDYKEFTLCDFAVRSGYYDQSHMNKSYQKIVGCLPKNFSMELAQL